MNKTTKLNIFDMDGTLLNTYEPDKGKVKYKELHGVDWPHGGWWGRVESLNMLPVTSIPLIHGKYQASLSDPNTHTVIMTGRHDSEKMREAVTNALTKAGVTFPHNLLLHPGKQSPDDWKISQVKELAKQHPELQEINMWDDRGIHVEKFRQALDGKLFSTTGKPIKVNVIHVTDKDRKAVTEQLNQFYNMYRSSNFQF